MSIYFKPNISISLCCCIADWLDLKHKCNKNLDKTRPFILNSELHHSEMLGDFINHETKDIFSKTNALNQIEEQRVTIRRKRQNA